MKNTRVIYSDNGTLVDLTNQMSNYHSGTYTFSAFNAAQDYIYIGNIAPFNHFYLKMQTASVASTQMSVTYWTGDTWRAVVELSDETEGLTQDGFVTFVPDRDHGWVYSDTDSSGQSITGLTGITIYDRYWIRISFSQDLTANSVVKWIGQIFSNDQDLGSEYAELLRSNVLTSFEAGKTNWEEQHVRAAQLIVEDLIKKQIIFSKGQILDRDTFMLPSVSKVAQIIYSNFGDDYVDQAKRASAEYDKRMDKSIYPVDTNLDGELDPIEYTQRQGFMGR